MIWDWIKNLVASLAKGTEPEERPEQQEPQAPSLPPMTQAAAPGVLIHHTYGAGAPVLLSPQAINSVGSVGGCLYGQVGSSGVISTSMGDGSIGDPDLPAEKPVELHGWDTDGYFIGEDNE